MLCFKRASHSVEQVQHDCGAAGCGLRAGFLRRAVAVQEARALRIDSVKEELVVHRPRAARHGFDNLLRRDPSDDGTGGTELRVGRRGQLPAMPSN